MTLEQRITRADYCKHGQPMDDGCNECDQEANTKAAPVTAETALVLAGVAPDGVAPEKVAEAVNLSLPPGAFMTDDHRYYFNGKGPVPSVTTVLGILDKPAVGVWKAKEAARAMLRATQRGWPDTFNPASEDEAISWALKEADKARDTAAALGSSVHLLADLVGASESDSTGFQVGPDTFPYVQAFRSFLDRYGRSSIVSSEHIVWSLNGYAGTYDLIMRMSCQLHSGRNEFCEEPELWLIDIKTSKGYYPEYGLQLAGYRWADSIILKDNPSPYPMPQIQRTGVLHLRPDKYPDTGWRLIEYPTTYEDDYLAFLACLELYQWKQKGRFTKSNLHKP